MKKIIAGLFGLLVVLLPVQRVLAYSHGNRYGGSSEHSYGSSSHSNAYGGSTSHTAGEGTTHSSAYGTDTSHSAGGGTSHTNAYGGSTSGEYGEGATHTNTYGGSTSAAYGEGATHTNTYGGTTSAAYGEGAYHTNTYGATTYASAYHPPTAYYGYHPSTTVNYYGSTCANVNGWATAAAVTGAAVATTAAISANNSATAANAYSAGYNAGATTSQPVATVQQAPPPTAATYTVGQTFAALPPGGVTSTTTVQGATYYQCGTAWFSPAFGANGVYYRVVPDPTAPQSPQAAEKVLALMQQLNLTPQQEVAIIPILKAEVPQLEAIKNDPSIQGMQKLQAFRVLHNQYEPQLQSILSPGQYAQLQGALQAAVRKAIQAKISE
ncbi:MAG: hypothetical protein WCH43_00675 [Verrucomicrobiota bacterium]